MHQPRHFQIISRFVRSFLLVKQITQSRIDHLSYRLVCSADRLAPNSWISLPAFVAAVCDSALALRSQPCSSPRSPRVTSSQRFPQGYSLFLDRKFHLDDTGIWFTSIPVPCRRMAARPADFHDAALFVTRSSPLSANGSVSEDPSLTFFA